MNKQEFMVLMKYPKEWDELNMYPDELFEIQVSNYKPGHEEGSEHDRNGAFHWWLRRNPSKEQLIKLAKLTHLDPDQLMANDVKNYIKNATNYDNEVGEIL